MIERSIADKASSKQSTSRQGTLSAQPGKFISLEGTEGVGKSTNLTFIEEYLRNQGIDVVVTREPGGTELGEALRHLLLEHREDGVEPFAELLMVFASRAQHVERVIKPALQRGSWVLSDRFTDASYAYQGAGRGVSKSFILQLEKAIQNGLQPDLTILLDIDVQIGLERARGRGDLDRFEREDIAFFERVREGYHSRITQFPGRYHVVDASRKLEDVQEAIADGLAELLAA